MIALTTILLALTQTGSLATKDLSSEVCTLRTASGAVLRFQIDRADAAPSAQVRIIPVMNSSWPQKPTGPLPATQKDPA